MRTQWRVGMSGLIGLDYNVLFRVLDRLALAPEDYDEMFADIRAMESAALEAVRADD